MTTWINTTSTAANWTINYPMTFTSAALPLPQARPRSSLDWLDDEIERTCALARKWTP